MFVVRLWSELKLKLVALSNGNKSPNKNSPDINTDGARDD